MEQAKIEQLAFLYLCSEHDKRLLLKKEKMLLADFDRLTYLIYHLGFKEYHIKVWMEFAGDFKKEWACLEALQETGGCAGKTVQNQKSDSIRCGFRNFVKMHQWKPENGYGNWSIKKKYDIIVNENEFSKSGLWMWIIWNGLMFLG